MLRVLTVAGALSLFAATAHAGQYDASQGRFSVNVPDGWTTERPTNPDYAVAIMKEVTEENKALCIVGVKAFPESASFKQAEIDEAFGKIATREFWEAALKASGATGVEPGVIRTRRAHGVAHPSARPDALCDFRRRPSAGPRRPGA